MFIILHPHTNFNTSRAKSDADAYFRFRSLYSHLISNIDFHNLYCECGSNSWSLHGYYSRYYSFLKRKIRVRILRLKCSTCGRTHALLIDDMIPFSTLSYSEVIHGISDDYIIDTSHHHYLKIRYPHTCSYTVMSKLSTRNLFLRFIST